MDKSHLIFQKRYKALSGFQVYERIAKIFENQCPLSDYQKYWLRTELGDSGFYGNLDMPFQAYEWEKEPEKRSVAQIIATPFVLLLNVFLAIFVCPFKWLLTTKFLFDTKGRFSKWLYKVTIWAVGEKY